LNDGKNLEEIAVLRQRQLGTVVNTVAALVEQGEISFDEKWVDPTRRSVIEAACMTVGIQWLKPIKESLPRTYRSKIFDWWSLGCGGLRPQRNSRPRDCGPRLAALPVSLRFCFQPSERQAPEHCDRQ